MASPYLPASIWMTAPFFKAAGSVWPRTGYENSTRIRKSTADRDTTPVFQFGVELQIIPPDHPYIRDLTNRKRKKAISDLRDLGRLEEYIGSSGNGGSSMCITFIELRSDAAKDQSFA